VRRRVEREPGELRFEPEPSELRKPLPSWKDGPVTDTIIRFVRRVTNPSGPNYVPPDERIAVFDSDGTLWCERPASALAFFVMRRLAEQAPENVDSPALRQLTQAARAGDYDMFQALDLRTLSDILVHTNAGLTSEQFTIQAHDFLGGALHPRFGIPFGQLTYRPMLELLAFLQGKEFRAFIVAGGAVEFVRASSEELYGVPQERVAGATVDYSSERLDGKILMIRTRTLLGEAGEGEAKVRSILQRLGRRPILAVGNSAGDHHLLEYTHSGVQSSLCLLIRHDDARREYAYSSGGSLEAAVRHGWTIVSMRDDFRRIFSTPNGSRREAPGR
jgi:phosphoserine phosphatase